jgi:hypothetical protein
VGNRVASCLIPRWNISTGLNCYALNVLVHLLAGIDVNEGLGGLEMMYLGSIQNESNSS